MSSASPQKGGEARPDFLARFLAAIPLLVLYFALAALYAWQASRRPVPTIFTDELELTQLTRAIADTGEPARRGVPYDGLATLVAYVLAPVWWFGSATESFAVAKLVLVLAMTATIFPAYGLARMVVPKWYALAAASAAVAVPALAYAPILVEEPLAYPICTLALWLIARCIERLTWGRLAAAFAICVVGALTRSQLAILVMVLALGLLWLGWQSEPIRSWRSSWSGWDWVGGVMLAIGVVLALAAAMGHASTAWRNTMLLYKDRVVEHATWALGALAIGMGILPVIAGLSALARPKSERQDPRTRAFVVTSLAALGLFVLYAGVKGAYNSTVFATYVVERNLIYLCPILFAATALAFARGIGRGWAVAGAGIFTLLVVARTPLHLDFPYYEAHGFSIATLANREFAMPKSVIEGVLLGVGVVSFLVVVVLKLVRPRSTAFTAIAASAAAVVLAWGLTGQVYAAAGERDLSERIDGNLPQPKNWVQEATNGEPVVVLGQQITDPTNIQETEFFNPAIKLMWSLDGTAIRVGSPIKTPDLNAVDGTLTPVPGTKYALAVNGVKLQAPIVAEKKNEVLYRIDDGPIKLQEALVGRQTDGWMVGSSEDPVASASYTRYAVSADEPGFAAVQLSREFLCPRPGLRKTGKATVRIGPVGIGPQQPRITRVTETRRFNVRDCQANGVTLTPPVARDGSPVPWRMEITIAPTVRPKDLDPTESESRYLGAQIVEAGFRPLFGS